MGERIQLSSFIRVSCSSSSIIVSNLSSVGLIISVHRPPTCIFVGRVGSRESSTQVDTLSELAILGRLLITTRGWKRSTSSASASGLAVSTSACGWSIPMVAAIVPW
jgi:hypothetical protein